MATERRAPVESEPDVFTRAEAPGLCPVCDHTGRVLRPQQARRKHPDLQGRGRVMGLPCPSCHPDAARAALEARRQEAIEAAFRAAGAPVKFLSATLDEFCEDPGMLRRAGLSDVEIAARKSWKAQIRAYIDRLDAHLGGGVGLSLTGTPGTGKTLGLCIVAGEIVRRRRSVSVMPERSIFEAIKAGYDRGESGSEAALVEKLASVGVLAIDDFGIRKASEWVIDIYHGIIDTRWDRDLPTLISSNLHLKALSRIYPRQMDRLARNVGIEMVGTSLRGTCLER